MRRADAPDGRKNLVRWYTEHARRWLTRRVDRLSGRIGLEPSGITVQDLGYRWGSCGRAAACTSTGAPSSCRRGSPNTSSPKSWSTSTSPTGPPPSGPTSNAPSLTSPSKSSG